MYLYALLPKKTEQTYNLEFAALKNLQIRLHLSSILVDFVKAAMSFELSLYSMSLVTNPKSWLRKQIFSGFKFCHTIEKVSYLPLRNY